MATALTLMRTKVCLSWILLACLALSTTSCSTLMKAYIPDRCSYHWRYEEANACYPCLNSTRMFLLPQTPCGTLRMDIVRDPCSCRMYLSTHCHVFCEEPFPCGLQAVSFKCECLGCTKTFEGWVFRGGQRLLLDENAFEMITTALWEGDCPVISLGWHKATITSKGFHDAYQKLMQ